MQWQGWGLGLDAPPQLLTPSKFGGTESRIPGNVRGRAGALAASHQMSPRDDPTDVVQSPHITLWGCYCDYMGQQGQVFSNTPGKLQ